MDPNGGKKNLYNKLSKQECLRLLNEETFKRITLSFYKYTILDDLDRLRDVLYSQWQKIGVLGRIYIAFEGINAQLSVPEHNWGEFVRLIESHEKFKDTPFKIAVEDNGKSFFKLTIKIRKKIVEDGLDDNYDVTNVGKHLSAKQWNAAIEEGAVVVDMRNHYESEIGKFEGAICADVETFRDQLPIVKNALKGKEKEKILLYCTGGIRCEKASSYLKHYGFKNVSQLHGGIIDYVRQLNQDKDLSNKFSGRNFVFDERRGERVSDHVISNCHQCGDPHDQHVNCRNVNCNLLFLQCVKCQKKYKYCCSLECIKISRLSKEKQKSLRKGIQNKKIYYSHKRVNLNLDHKINK